MPPPSAATTEKQANKPIRQDLRPILQHHPALGVSGEISRYLGAGLYPSSEKGKSMLRGQLVFQVRGVSVDETTGEIKPAILSHVGRSLDAAPGAPDEWSYYETFRKEEVIYNADKLLTDEFAIQQAREAEFVLICETPLDVARCVEGGVLNAVASFVPALSEHQLEPLELIKQKTGAGKFLVIYNRQNIEGQEQAVNLLRQYGFQADGFNWEVQYRDRERGLIGISPDIERVSDFSQGQVAFVLEKARQYQKKSLAPSIER